MNTFKVQKIRSCVQCGSVLNKKCKACLAHPERKPQVVTLYDWPPILEHGPCGCCVRIACQLSGCTNDWVWRHVKRKNGKATAKNFYCTVLHRNRAQAGAQRLPKVETTCAYKLCGKTILKDPWKIKQTAESYCHATCQLLERSRRANEAKIAAKAVSEEPDPTSLLECLNGCQGNDGDKITEHEEISKGRYRCVNCGKMRIMHESKVMWEMQKGIRVQV